MKPEHVVAVVLRLFAIFLAVSILSFLASSPWYYIMSAPDKGLALLVIAFMIFLAFSAFALWRYPFWIASKLLRFDDAKTRLTAPSVSFEEIQAVAFTVMGVYFCLARSPKRFIGSPCLLDHRSVLNRSNGHWCCRLSRNLSSRVFWYSVRRA